MEKKFIGWTNIKKFITEMVNTLSDKPSKFSKKRIQSWILFTVAVGLSTWWFATHIKDMKYEQCIAFTGMYLAYGGFTINAIQKEKKNKIKDHE